MLTYSFYRLLKVKGLSYPLRALIICFCFEAWSYDFRALQSVSV